MRLYFYEHCPYCVRVLMLIHAKKLPVELIVLPNDDVDTPIKLIGKKMLPILITQEDKPLPESLAIIDYLDHLTDPMITDTHVDPALTQWLSDIAPTNRSLVYPRMVQHNFVEFQTESARNYFITKKFGDHESMEELLKNTKQLAASLHEHWSALEGIISQWPSDSLSMNDIVLFPILLNMSLYEKLNPPKAVINYMLRMAELTGLGLFSH